MTQIDWSKKPEGLTLAPILQNLRRAMGNKPPAQAEGIKSIIDVLENARDIQALRGKV